MRVRGSVATLVSYLPALFWAALLLFIGGRSDVPTVRTDLPLDKVAHLAAFAVLGLLLASARQRPARRGALILILMTGALVGAADELHQKSVAGRSAELLDWLVDVVGTGAGALLHRRFMRNTRNVV